MSLRIDRRARVAGRGDRCGRASSAPASIARAQLGGFLELVRLEREAQLGVDLVEAVARRRTAAGGSRAATGSRLGVARRSAGRRGRRRSSPRATADAYSWNVGIRRGADGVGGGLRLRQTPARTRREDVLELDGARSARSSRRRSRTGSRGARGATSRSRRPYDVEAQLEDARAVGERLDVDAACAPAGSRLDPSLGVVSWSRSISSRVDATPGTATARTGSDSSPGGALAARPRRGGCESRARRGSGDRASTARSSSRSNPMRALGPLPHAERAELGRVLVDPRRAATEELRRRRATLSTAPRRSGRRRRRVRARRARRRRASAMARTSSVPRCASIGHAASPRTVSSTSTSRSSSRMRVCSSAALHAARSSALARSRRSAGVRVSSRISTDVIAGSSSGLAARWASLLIKSRAGDSWPPPGASRSSRARRSARARAFARCLLTLVYVRPPVISAIST